jgi:hypothetical protein
MARGQGLVAADHHRNQRRSLCNQFQEPEGLGGGMQAAVGVSEPDSGPDKGNDDCGTGGRGQGGLCRKELLRIQNTNVFGPQVTGHDCGQYRSIRNWFSATLATPDLPDHLDTRSLWPMMRSPETLIYPAL